MKLEKVSIQDVFPSEDGSLKLIFIDRDGNKSINYYPKSYEHIYLNDMYFFMNQGYIVLDNDCVPVNPIILTDDMIGKQVQLLNGQIHTVYKGMHDSHYTIGKHSYDCFGHSRPLPSKATTLSPDYRVKYVISERGSNYFSSITIVNLKEYHKLRNKLLTFGTTKIGKAQNERLKHTKTNFKTTT